MVCIMIDISNGSSTHLLFVRHYDVNDAVLCLFKYLTFFSIMHNSNLYLFSLATCVSNWIANRNKLFANTITIEISKIKHFSIV